MTPNRHNHYAWATLAVSIALATGSTAAMAATVPAATQLPGQGKVLAGHATDAGTGIVNGHQTIDIGGHAVISWGTAADATLNATGQPAGFNIGSDAALTFNGTDADAVLNIDASGNPSRIFGTLNGTDANVFVANPNGIVVGKGASISSTGEVGLIANVLGDNSAFDGGIADIAYDGTGGDVTVQAGSSIGGGSVWVAGGGNVNVDLGALAGGAATLNAGLGQNGGGLASSNKSANLSVSGQLGAGSMAGFHSAGSATNLGVLDLTGVGSAAGSSLGGLSVGGTFTNKGQLTLPHRNDGLSMVNEGELSTVGSGHAPGANSPAFTSLINNGIYLNSGNDVVVSGGDLINNGTIDLGNAGGGGYVLLVGDGKINNHGTMENVGNLTTQYNSATPAGTNVGINNDGVISGDLSYVYAGEPYPSSGALDNDVRGNFTNSGSLIFTGGGAGYRHRFLAHDGISMAGSLMSMAPGADLGSAKAISAKNPLNDAFGLYALNGTARMATELAFKDNASSLSNTGVGNGNAGATFQGRQVELMSNITGVSSGNSDTINIVAGGAPDSGYAVRVGNDATVSAGTVAVGGQQATDVKGRPIAGYGHPNIILQGVLSGDHVDFGTGDHPVADVFSGPEGGIYATGDAPTVAFNFTGIIKNAPYTNSDNFRYNYLPISSDSPLALTLNPVAYLTNGTSNGRSAVNVMVDNDVALTSAVARPALVPGAGGTAITGTTDIPNTHLVLQSSGDISTTGDFYWPGFVYLGTVASKADGSVAPGTLGQGRISLGGDFNNVLPGDISGAAGVHFITGLPLDLGGTVTTNANSWVNFATDTLTQAYVTGVLGDGQFFGGTQGAGKVVNYGVLDASMFHLREPVAER